MELALYDPELGYYTRPRLLSGERLLHPQPDDSRSVASQSVDPFGRHGDFFTASQLQPVFGRLIAAALRDLIDELPSSDRIQIVELGPGRGEMAPALAPLVGAERYLPIDIGSGEGPSAFTGVVFSNEFFDALPVDLAMRRGKIWLQRRVAMVDGAFAFLDGEPVDPDQQAQLDRYAHTEQTLAEVHHSTLLWLHRIAGSLKRGFVLTIDYGYISREAIRFPQGTLMSYRHHAASPNVLLDPGRQDITSHVPFSMLMEEGQHAGLETISFTTLTQFLLSLGEPALQAAIATEEDRQRTSPTYQLQLKTLLFGMGETFRVLLQRKV
jgi:SAM-dependent MidA family methyltransferase